jgi:hypothetical protein
MRERDVDAKAGLFFVLHTKEGKEKLVPMLDEDKELVKSLPIGFPDLPFFRHAPGVSGCKAGQPFGEKYLYKWWKRACDNLGINGVDLYGGTRHSTATALREFLSPEQIKAGTMHKWWRRRESNPRPKILPSRIYMLSSGIGSRAVSHPEPGYSTPACFISSAATGAPDNQPVEVDAPNPATGEDRGTAQQLKLLLRSYNRLRLYLGSVIFTS